jgi:hypothetical protein
MYQCVIIRGKKISESHARAVAPLLLMSSRCFTQIWKCLMSKRWFRGTGKFSVWYCIHNAQLVCGPVHLAIQKKIPRKLSQNVTVLHNTHLHMTDLTMMTSATLGQEFINRFNYSSDVMVRSLFLTYKDKWNVKQWTQLSQAASFFVARISALLQWCKKSFSVQGHCPELRGP